MENPNVLAIIYPVPEDKINQNNNNNKQTTNPKTKQTHKTKLKPQQLVLPEKDRGGQYVSP